jgi:hypothetical protein
MTDKLIDVVVKRSKWFRGQGSDESYLLSEDGLMCCMGFAALAQGVPRERILDRQTFLSTKMETPAGNKCNQTIHQLYVTNDDDQMDDEWREAEIKRLGLLEGYNFSFAD